MIVGKDELPKFIDSNSTGWLYIFRSINEVLTTQPELQAVMLNAKTAFDLGSEKGQSAYALMKICPNLEKIYCVDNMCPLGPLFKDKLVSIAEEKRMTMEKFVEGISLQKGPFADVIMLASLQGQPFNDSTDLGNLARSIRGGGILYEIHPDYETPLSKFFKQIVRNSHVTVWQRNDDEVL
jgi:hypothetical protein